MNVIIEIAQALFSGIGLAIYAVWNVLKLCVEVNGVRNVIIAAAIGVPVFVVPLLSFAVSSLVKFIKR